MALTILTEDRIIALASTVFISLVVVIRWLGKFAVEKITSEIEKNREQSASFTTELQANIKILNDRVITHDGRFEIHYEKIQNISSDHYELKKKSMFMKIRLQPMMLRLSNLKKNLITANNG